MRFRAFLPTLAAAVADAARALPGRPTIPILNTVRVTATEDGRVEIVGYDFDVCIRATVEGADVDEPGVVLAPGRPLAAFLGGMPDGTVTVDHDGTRLTVAMPRVRYGLRTRPVEDYPGLPDLSPIVGALDAADLARALTCAATAARPVAGVGWSGLVQLTVVADRLTIAATDRYTAAVAVAPLVGGPVGGPVEPVTAEVAAKPLADALRGMAGDVDLCIGDGAIGVATADRVFTSRRLVDEFPQVHTFSDRLPEPTTRVVVRADELAGAMARASRVVADKGVPVRLTVSKDQGLSYDASSEGESQVDGEIDVERMSGDPVVLGVNPLYLADACKTFGDSLVELGARGPLKGLTVTSPEAPGDIHIIQPIKLP